MLNKVKEYIAKHHLLSLNKHYIVALSGGGDSVCLLLVMHRLGYHIEAAHCNFHLRQDESNRDEAFVINLCKQLNIELHLIHFDTETYAKTHKISIEMAARELRYNYFEQLRRDICFDGICVAHHQDDSVETILLNLIRGTGVHGLTGIKPRNGNILRPLLCVSKSDITKWLNEQHQDYVTDSTNLQTDAVRNKIRLKIIPLLREINPSVENSIMNTAQHLEEVASLYDNTVGHTLDKLISDNSLDIQALLQEPAAKSIVFEWLKPYHFSSAIIEQIFDSISSLQAGKEWHSDSHHLAVHQNRLVLEKKQAPLPTFRIPEQGNYIYDNDHKIKIELYKGKCIYKNIETACLDKSKIIFPLVIRPIQAGDRFQPFGMKGTKLVSDYLTDCHLSIFEKRRSLVLCDANGQILWLVNHRPDARFCVNDITQETLVFSFFNTKK